MKYFTAFVFLMIMNCAFSQDSLSLSPSFDFKNLTKVFSTQGTISGTELLNHYKQFGNEKENEFYKLDGTLSAHYFLGDKYDYYWSPLCFDRISMSKINKWMLELNMDVDLRMFKEESSPVRTSYKPGIKLHYSPFHSQPDVKRKTIHAFSASFYHYSNGQNGETFALNAHKSYEPPLLVVDSISNAINSAHVFNRFNGSFSTNYLTIAHHYYKLLNDYFIINTNLEYQHIFNDSVYEKDLETYLSRDNIIADVSLLWGGLHHGKPMEKYRLNIYAKYALGDNSSLNPELNSFYTDLNISATFYWRLPATSHAALFLKAGYSGSDPHNIYLEDRNAYFKIGLASGFFIYQDGKDKKEN